MLIRLAPNRDDREALALDDLASQLDAGLGIDQIGGNPALGERVLGSLLTGRGVRLRDADEAMLEASWVAGRSPATLRRMATARRQRAQFARDLLASLRYPVALLLVAVVVSIVVGSALHILWLPVTVLGLCAAIAVALTLAGRSLHRDGTAFLRVPLVGEFLASMSELPYLEVLHGLYASGVQLLPAHARAVAACPVAAVRRDLAAADAVLQTGQSLAAALRGSTALHHETRQLIENGERTGGLEGALERALGRRSEVAARQLDRLARLFGLAVKGFALCVALFVIWSFYSSYFGLLRGYRH